MAQQVINVDVPNSGNGAELRTAFIETNANFTELYAIKVDKVTGKGLSSNDFTNDDKTKLDGIATGAEVNVQADWNQNDNTQDDYIKNKPVGLLSISSKRYVGAGQDYELPIGAIAFKGWINDGIQHLEDPDFLSDLNTITQSGTTVTFKMAITAGKRIIIDYHF